MSGEELTAVRPGTQPGAQNRYQYQTLNEAQRHIRLFKLSPGAFGSPIRGSLVHYGLDELHANSTKCLEERPDCFVWYALSYVWGSKPPDQHIEINGQYLPITATLIEALQELRQKTGEVVIWIDQICIDQNTLGERSHQVSLMHEIFRNAIVVIAWLGPDSKEHSRSFASIAKVGRRISDWFGTNHALSDDPVERLRSHQQLLRATLLKDLPGSVDVQIATLQKHFSDVICNTWFKRVWTFQEAVLAQRLFLLFGHSATTWIEFENIITLLTKIFISHSTKVLSLEVSPNIYSLLIAKFQSRVSPDDWSTLTRATRSFSKNLFDMSAREANDDKDFVYGQLAIFDAKVRQTLKPDYTLSVEKVFISATLAILDADQDLMVLESCCAQSYSHSRKYNLPSWCKDWSQKWSTCGVCEELAEASMESPLGIPFCATPNTILSIHYEGGEENCLRLKGLVVDDIHCKCVLGHAGTYGDPDLVIDMIQQIIAYLSNLQEKQRQAVGRAILNGFASPLMELRARYNEPAYVCEWLHECSDQEKLLEKLTMTEDKGLRNLLRCFLAMAMEMTCLFETKNGFFGKSCGHIRPGDKICLFFGHALPFVLREVPPANPPDTTLGPINQQQTKYQLIGGACYVNGLVDGEGLELAKERGIEPQELCIV